MAVQGVRLTKIDVGVTPSTFELLVVRVVSHQSSCVAAVVYRPGSAAVTSLFFSELSDVLDRIAPFVEPVLFVGNVNIHLEAQTNIDTAQFVDVLAAHGLVSRVTSATHDLGGMLDVVVSRADLPSPDVGVLDVGLSDHRLLRWSSSLTRPAPVYTTSTGRPWQRLDTAAFTKALQSSSLCRPDMWSDLSVDDLAQLYESVLTAMLDDVLPVRTVRCRRRPSDPWYDDDCRQMKRQVRRLEREYRQSEPGRAAHAAETWRAYRRTYRDLLREKRESFWAAKVDSERSHPSQLWQSIDRLLGRGSAPTNPDISASIFHRFFDDKVAGVRAATSGAPPPSFSSAPSGCSWFHFQPLTVEDVTTAVRQLPDKYCVSDPIPTSLLKDNIHVLAPFLTFLFNRSLSLGSVPAILKAAYITPRLKKPDLDTLDVKSYRPISNLPVLSKVLERLVAKQLLSHLDEHKLLPDLQSAYRAHHSTETAVLKVLSDILTAVDNGDLAMLALLDLSAAFDSVDQKILLRRLEISYGLDGVVLQWFVSYLDHRTQFVRCRGDTSTPLIVEFGVPQGSVLGPILFLLYTADILTLIQSYNLQPHLYADDTQVYGFCRPGAIRSLESRVSDCISAVADWMSSNRLQLNATKTEILWCTSSRRQHQLPVTQLTVGNDQVTPVTSVRNLGIYMDSDLSMRTHVIRTAAGCFAVLRRIRSIRRSVTQPVLQSLVVALVLSRLDYGSTVLFGLPQQLVDKLQSVQNAAARLVLAARRRDHISPLLQSLHWLRVVERITFRLAVLTYRCLHGSAPDYLSRQLQRVSDVCTRRRLRSSSSTALVISRTVRATIGDRAFSAAATSVWNSLPEAVRSSASLDLFRKSLKTALFARSYTNYNV